MSATEIKPEPTFVQAKPFAVDLVPGKNQPFCDGSHKAAKLFKPKKLRVDEAKTYYICGCKWTHNEEGFCDGTHCKEEGLRKYNEFLLKSNNKLKTDLEAAERKQRVANVVAALSTALIVVGISVRYFDLMKK
ncbi:hypothetical protein BDB01DRAFT_726387 [Pilobolus umbonatus]|nr:hypothetical protein BDB01DRAFT_726387 [Pilobolus umbonatus]